MGPCPACSFIAKQNFVAFVIVIYRTEEAGGGGGHYWLISSLHNKILLRLCDCGVQELKRRGAISVSFFLAQQGPFMFV